MLFIVVSHYFPFLVASPLYSSLGAFSYVHTTIIAKYRRSIKSCADPVKYSMIRKTASHSTSLHTYFHSLSAWRRSHTPGGASELDVTCTEEWSINASACDVKLKLFFITMTWDSAMTTIPSLSFLWKAELTFNPNYGYPEIDLRISTIQYCGYPQIHLLISVNRFLDIRN